MLERFKFPYKIHSSLLLFFLLYFVFLDEAANNLLITDSSKRFPYESILIYIMQGLQIVFSCLQAGFSDYYLRRKSLIFSITATIVALVIFKFSITYGAFFIISSIVFKGIFGNTLPIAWAGISDLTRANNFRFALALSICALAVGSWGSLFVIPLMKGSTFFYCTLIIVSIGLILVFCFFRDREDLPKAHFLEKKSFFRLISDECLGIYFLAKKPVIALVLVTFLFSEISFYQILFRIEVFSTYYCLVTVPFAIGVGYTLGTIVLKYIKSGDKFVSSLGLLFSFIGIILIVFLNKINHENPTSFTLLFIFYSFGYAFFTPALFSLITPKDHPHLQGKIYGILESVDSLASLLTFVMIFNTKTLSCNSVFLFSLLMISLCALLFIFVCKWSAPHLDRTT